MSLAAWIPSSLSAFSITLLRSRACRSSALIEQPIVQLGVRRSCVKKDETRAAMSQACRPGRRSVQRRRRRRPTDDLRTTVRRRRRSAAKSDESSAVRRADLSSSIPPEIRRILSDTDSDYANVASNQICGERASDGAARVRRHQLLQQPGARGAGDNSGGRMSAPPALQRCADSPADSTLGSAATAGSAVDRRSQDCISVTESCRYARLTKFTSETS